MKTIDRDVLIVGAGPTGLACAALLARGGASVEAITRYRGLANSPRAHIINQRTMEVFRDLGIEDRVAAAAMPPGLMGQVIWAESLAGAEIARRRGWGADRRTDYEAASPCPVTNIPQHVLEPILCDAARDLGATVTLGRELVSMTQDAEGVVSLCRDRDTGEELLVRSRYAIGADGDNSTVCRELGFELEGESGLAHMLNDWFTADLAPYVAHRPGALYQVFRPGGEHVVDNAVFVNVRPWTEWVMSVPYDPREGMPSPEADAVRNRVRHYVGDNNLEVTPISTSTWTVNQMHAERMHSGRVVIAGNAAHRHPPAGGLGANTCVQDAFNLAWKLELLLAGVADEGILTTYTAERAPVARQIVDRANASLGGLMAIPDAVGLRPGMSAHDGEAQFHRRFENTDEGRQIRDRLEAAVEMQDDNFNALGVELGQFYRSDAITPDSDADARTAHSDRHYAPSTAPGSPLPHAWLTRGTQSVSSLDLVGRGQFTVLIGIGGHIWRAAAVALADELGLSIRVVSIGPGCDVDDPYSQWRSLSEIDDAGCLVVRPDRFVAYRSRSGADDPSSTLRGALQAAVCAPVASRV
ncbi:FAD-dependent monooxygenase [Paramicrobacterium chengjingii]|uniref:FAD-dependent monooxygenase n=1 Tax=Paramicrobacterium chengjingii TaxID=2769067 RepID=UPI001423D9EA|nr:FAD-dependent monooxygenase [Microbacterium chengjingii]